MPPPLQHVPDEESFEFVEKSNDDPPASARSKKPKDGNRPAIFDLTSSKRNRNALLFAVLIYDFRHAEIIKILKDDIYWDSLDTTVGPQITVFTFHCPASRSAKSSPQPLQFTQKVKKLFGDNFGDPKALPMPAIMFFQVDKNDVIGSYFVKVEGKSIEEAFHDARSILKTASEVIAGVSPKYRENRREIFDLVEERVRQQRVGRTIISATKAALPFKSLFSIFLAVFGLGGK